MTTDAATDTDLLPGEPTLAEKEEIYTSAVLTAMEIVLLALQNALSEGVTFPKPLPPRIAAAAITQAITLAGIVFGKDQGMKMSALKDILQSSIKLSEIVYPELKED